MPNKPNYKQVFATKKKNEEKILKICPIADNRKGIYAFWRIDENGFKFAYVGQSGSKGGLLGRLAEHLSGFQHIDLSIKKYNLYDAKKNPYGYRIKICCYCNTQEELNQKEQEWIKKFADNSFQLRNKNIGSQGKGKVGINDNKPPKTYQDGLLQGDKRTKRKVKEYFDKYLDVSIRQPSNKIKERKYNEFKEWLEDGE